ncbi:MAG: fatty acyl-AMP ligase [Acidobacteria bacterium]|nr:fatty acyl-AMP ligase [Acidobacteriota bacterium]
MRGALPNLNRIEKEENTSSSPLSFVLIDDAGDVHRISRSNLLGNAAKCAGFLREEEIGYSQHVLLILPHSPELLYWIFGCFMAGAVPSVFSSPGGNESGAWERIRNAAVRIKAIGAVTKPESMHRLKSELKGTGCRVLPSGNEWLGMDVNAGRYVSELKIPGYVQITSGTTGKSKAVVLSGKAIDAYVYNMATGLKIRANDVVVNCLPLSHDFALFGGVLMPFSSNIPAVLISPSKWVRRPAVLLRMIHDYGGTISWLPNSGFVHCARFALDREMTGIDLSRLRVMINGAEPVLHSSNQLFLQRFSEYGLREEALASGYGMAENTLAATFTSLEKRASVIFVHGRKLATGGIAAVVPETNPDAVPVVSCGKPLRGTKIRIVNREGHPLPEGRVGEILIRSMSLFSEYAGDHALTEKALAGGWFHSGDLGFIMGNELFFAGRIKDLIIVGGRNIAPMELEKAAAEVSGVRPGQVVAFGVPDESIGTERVILICTVRKRDITGTGDDMVRMIRQHVARKTGVAIADVKLVRKGWIERTVNGKLARSKNREKYLSQMNRESTD